MGSLGLTHLSDDIVGRSRVWEEMATESTTSHLPNRRPRPPQVRKTGVWKARTHCAEDRGGSAVTEGLGQAGPLGDPPRPQVSLGEPKFSKNSLRTRVMTPKCLMCLLQKTTAAATVSGKLTSLPLRGRTHCRPTPAELRQAGSACGEVITSNYGD